MHAVRGESLTCAPGGLRDSVPEAADVPFDVRDNPTPVPPVIDGPVLISAGDLNGFEFGSSVLNPYEAFRGLKPSAYVQDGVFVFDGRFAVPLASALGACGCEYQAAEGEGR